MDSKDVVLATLADNYIQVHEYLLRALQGDGTTAIILSKAVSFYKYNEARGSVVDGKVPFNTQYIEETLGINEYKQRTALEKLEKMKLLTIDYQGYPKRRFIILNFFQISSLLSQGKNKKKTQDKSPDKTSFYKALNDGMVAPYHKAIEVSGNIDRNMFAGMYALSKVCFRATGDVFEWSSITFGKFKAYWKACYSEKEYDFSKFIDFEKKLKQQTPHKVSVLDWVSFDRSTPDKHYSEHMNIEEYCSKVTI